MDNEVVPQPEGGKEDSTEERLEEWRLAERDASTENPESPTGRLARRSANRARTIFHEREDAAHVEAGDLRPRTPAGPDEAQESA